MCVCFCLYPCRHVQVCLCVWNENVFLLSSNNKVFRRTVFMSLQARGLRNITTKISQSIYMHDKMNKWARSSCIICMHWTTNGIHIHFLPLIHLDITQNLNNSNRMFTSSNKFQNVYCIYICLFICVYIYVYFHCTHFVCNSQSISLASAAAVITACLLLKPFRKCIG